MKLNAAIVLAEPAAFVAGLAAIKMPVRTMAKARRPAIAVLAALSAAGAVAAGGSPTGWAPVDWILLAGLGAAAVWAGSRAPSTIILLAAVGAVAAGTGSIALPLALAASGLCLASILTESEQAVDAAAGGLVAQAALRATNPSGDGFTAIAAALILVPLLVSAFLTLGRRHRRKVYQVALGVLGFGVVAGAVGVAAAATAVEPLRKGLTVAGRAIDTTGPSGLSGTASGLEKAGADFAKARRALDAWWAWPARAVPVVGQNLAVLRAAARSGQDLASAGRRVLGAPALNDITVTNGRIPLDQLAAVEGPVADLAARTSTARRRLSDARSVLLVPPVADELKDQLGRLTDIDATIGLANRVLPLVPDLLGGSGPRRYFLAIQTPVEARAGGGFLGNFGEIRAEGGSLSLARLGRQEELEVPTGGTAPRLEGSDEYLTRYGRFNPAEEWSNVNLSPDFPSNARVMAELYPQTSGGGPVDGVIAVDPAALAAVLRLVGPVSVPSWPTPITPDNVLETLLFEQYQRFPQDARVDFLGEVAERAWRRLISGGLPPVPQLLSTLGPAVRDKHIFLWSNRPGEQRLFEDLKAAGKIAPVAGDFLGLVTQNAIGNKIDYFLRREVDYRAEFNPASGQLRATARIALHNEAPASGVGGPFIDNLLSPPLPKGSNKLLLSFYTPWNLVNAQVDGVRIDFERGTELGRQVYSTAIVIPPRSTVIVELDLSGQLAGDDTYRLDLYRQPMVAADDVTTMLTVPPGWLAPLTGPEEHTKKLRLESDATVTIPLGRG